MIYMPLDQLREYIKTNQHLPNIPKATTVVNNGLNISLLSVLRMEKIEELTLYLLEMNKRLLELEKENQGLEKLTNNFNDCDNVTVTGGNGEITISGFSPIYQVEIYDTNWQQQSSCTSTGGSCASPFSIGQGTYIVKVKLYTASWGWICEKTFTNISVTTGGGGGPCANNGGDTDGDGICNDVDNCDNTSNANQSDGDGDGIGDVCDNCPMVVNPNQADSNGNGTGDACESTGGGNSPTYTCGEIIATINSDNVEFSGTNLGDYHFNVQEQFGPNYAQHQCDGCAQISNLFPGTYKLQVIKAVGWVIECDEIIQLPGGSGGGNTGGGNTGGGTPTSGLWSKSPDSTYIYRDGKVMVGDTFMAEKIIVEANIFPDYVFQEDYDLMPLAKLQQYITTNKHLPNIPKGETIVKNGLDVGELSVLQMEKIEELTLYLLHINERVKKLEKEKEQLKQVLEKK